MIFGFYPGEHNCDHYDDNIRDYDYFLSPGEHTGDNSYGLPCVSQVAIALNRKIIFKI